MTMARSSNSIRQLAPRLLAVVWLLGCPRIGSAAGTWSVISLPQKPGQVGDPTALAVDTTGSLYVADPSTPGNDRIQKHDSQGNWSIVATAGDAPGQVYYPTAVAADTAGNLYVADLAGNSGRIQMRDAGGNWSVVAREGASALAADKDGNLYVGYRDRIEKRGARGNWSVIATDGSASGQVDMFYDGGLAVDTAGNLYVADTGNDRVQVYTPLPGS
jgi:hypothetical protein